MIDDPRYPIGRFEFEGPLTSSRRKSLIDEIAAAPKRLRAAAVNLTPEQLDTPYRPGGWTVRQVVHHVADSHLNAYVRFKLALTEDVPVIKPYDQERWAALEDCRLAPVETSLALLEALHERWVLLMRSLPEPSFGRTFNHPESGIAALDRIVALYAWHGKHHAAQILSLRSREGW